MATETNSITPGPGRVGFVPPLENGDCLSRPEFERRYEAMPDLKRAELIEGIVHVSSPVSLSHAEADALMMVWLGTYAAQTMGVRSAANATVRLDMLNEVQPDALLRLSGAPDVERVFIDRAPELVVEVASSSVSRDLHSKFNLYRRHGVREYVVWRILERDVDWFHLEDGVYARVVPGEDGILRSREFPGLWLDKPALLAGEMGKVLAVLAQGIGTPEHAEFVTRIAPQA